MLRNGIRRNAAERIPLTTRQNRNRQLIRFRSGEDKHNVRRRLFDCLQQRIPRFIGKHVRFVDDENLLAPFYRQKLNTFAEASDFINTTIGRSIHFDNIHRLTA